MQHNRPLIAALLLGAALATPGCHGEDETSLQQQLEDKGTVQLMEEVSKAEFEAPADGRLTSGQIEMYLAVRERGQEIRQNIMEELERRAGQEPAPPAAVPVVGPQPAFEAPETVAPIAAEPPEPAAETGGFVEGMETVGDIGDLSTADLRAAQELGFNVKEYEWIRDRVEEAQRERARLALVRRLAETRERFVASLAARRDVETDEARRAEIDRQIADLRQDFQSAEPDPDPVLTQNAELLSRFEGRFQDMESGEVRLAAGRRSADRREGE